MPRRFYLLLPAAVILALFFCGSAWIQAGTSSPALSERLLACGTCHSMEQEVQTWLSGPHRTVACLQCHAEGDPTWVRHEFLERNEEMATYQNPVNPLTIPLKIANDRCLECHDPQMPALLKDLYPAPLKAPVGASRHGTAMTINAAHDLHLNGSAQMTCLECHGGQVHGPAPGSPERIAQSHTNCQSCHDQKQVQLAVTGSVSCSACHVDPKVLMPQDHKQQNRWMADHGKRSLSDNCGECHLAQSAGPHGALANPTAFPTSQTDSCLSCHSNVAMPHGTGYLATHGAAYLKAPAGTCQSCHTPQGNPVTPAPAHAVAGFCTDCHLQPMPHPASFMARHGALAQAAPATCDACHSPKNPARPSAQHASRAFCASCHNAYQHPTGWVAGHGGKVTDSCATCHTLQGVPGQHNACSACHTASGIWHERMWFAKHGRIVSSQGDASCLKCHNEVQPSCAQCHRAYGSR